MTITCPVDLDVDFLNQQVHETYTRIAEDPHGDFHFHRGYDYAVNYLGYDPRELDTLPESAVNRFAGLGNPLAVGPVAPGETVLDLGCGAGMDLLLAARRVGRMGRAIGVDPNPAMRKLAWQAACKAGLAEQVEMREGSLFEIPVAHASVDVVISNGVLNLATDKAAAFAEIRRVLKPGGRLYLADAVIQGQFGPQTLSDPSLWAS
jgi:arsenite methyltransferase